MEYNRTHATKDYVKITYLVRLAPSLPCYQPLSPPAISPHQPTELNSQRVVIISASRPRPLGLSLYDDDDTELFSTYTNYQV